MGSLLDVVLPHYSYLYLRYHFRDLRYHLVAIEQELSYSEFFGFRSSLILAFDSCIYSLLTLF
jgi:hypothetical protein